MMQRRYFLATLSRCGAVVLGSAPILASAAETPGLARILCGFPAGGTADALSRRLADRMRPGYARTVVVENKPGAGGQIAMTALRDSPADGSVLCLTPSSLLSVNPHTFRKLPYRPQSDALAVSLLCEYDHALAVGPAVPASVATMADYLAWIRSGGTGSYGTPGTAGVPHLIGVMLTRQSGIGLFNVPYRGSAPAVQDLLGGQVGSVIAPLGEFLPYLKTGKLRLLAISGPSRSRFVGGVQTLREAGFDISVRDWFGIFMPPRTPDDVVAWAAASVRASVDSAELKSGFDQLAMEAKASTPAALAQRVAEEDRHWSGIVRTVGFAPE